MSQVTLKINEKEVPLNEIMNQMLKNIILGYLKTLKGLPEPMESIDINIPV